MSVIEATHFAAPVNADLEITSVPADVPWVSGLMISAKEYAQISEQKQRMATAAAARRNSLHGNTSMPLVFLDVSIRGRSLGRMEFASLPIRLLAMNRILFNGAMTIKEMLQVLFADVAPRAAENFRQLCTGEAGIVGPGHEGAGKAYHFKVCTRRCQSTLQRFSQCMLAIAGAAMLTLSACDTHFVCMNTVPLCGYALCSFRCRSRSWGHGCWRSNDDMSSSCTLQMYCKSLNAQCAPLFHFWFAMLFSGGFLPFRWKC